MLLSPCRCAQSARDNAPEKPADKDHANVYFPPPLIHLSAILIAVGLAWRYPLALPTGALSIGLGVVLLAVSMLIARAAFRQFSRNHNPVAPNKPIGDLMDGGPFRFTRNPLYVALALLQAGIGLISGSAWILLTLPPALLVVRYYVIAREEAYLTRRFGQAYLDYQSRVRRWL